MSNVFYVMGKALSSELTCMGTGLVTSRERFFMVPSSDSWRLIFLSPARSYRRFIQRTLVITILFVTKDFAVKSKLLLYRNLISTCLKHE